MSLIALAALLSLAGLLIWTIGAPLLRFGGALAVIVALISIAGGDPIASRLSLIALGSTAWLAGHFLAAYKTRHWHSRLAENIVTRTPLRYLDPVNAHAYRRARREARGETTEPNSEQTPATAPAQLDHFAEWERELTPAAPAPARRPAAKRAPARPAGPSRSAVYGKRAAKAATNLAVRKVPGARAARSAWRFLK